MTSLLTRMAGGAVIRRRKAQAEPSPGALPDMILWPSDANVVNVLDFGADPTGAADSTAAIQSAIDAQQAESGSFSPKMVYFPEGIYKVSNSIKPAGNRCRMCGAGKTKTTIRLADNSPGYGSSGTPKNVIEFGSSTSQKNSAYANYCEHMTIEIGAGNPGAAALEGSMANSGCMSHLRLIAPHGGLNGFRMAGTCGSGYIKDVTIEGFTRGIYGDNVDVNNYVFEDITIRNCGVGVYSGRNMQFLDLTIEDCATAIETTSAESSSIFVLRGTLTRAGSNAGTAIITPTRGFLYLRDVTATGYLRALQFIGSNMFSGSPVTIREWSSEDYWKGATKTAWTESEADYHSLHLPIKKAPEYHTNDFDKWEKVTTASAAGIQAAIDAANAAGKEIVYLPWQASSVGLTGVTIPTGSVKKLDLMFTPTSGEVVVTSAGLVIIENTTGLTVNHQGSGVTVARNLGSGGRAICGPGASGEFYVDNIGPHAYCKAGPGVALWARQINREKIGQLANNGGIYWLLGENIESLVQNNGTVVNPGFPTTNGGKTEIIGGATDPTRGPAHTLGHGPIYSANGGYLSIVQSGAWRANDGGDASYSWAIQDTWDGNTVNLYEQQAPIYTIFYVQSSSRKRMLYPLYTSAQWPPLDLPDVSQ